MERVPQGKEGGRVGELYRKRGQIVARNNPFEKFVEVGREHCRRGRRTIEA